MTDRGSRWIRAILAGIAAEVVTILLIVVAAAVYTRVSPSAGAVGGLLGERSEVTARVS